MYYTKRCPECGQKVHIHVKTNQNVFLKNCCEHLGDIRQPLYLGQTEKLFNARFRVVRNDDGSRTRIFI